MADGGEEGGQTPRRGSGAVQKISGMFNSAVTKVKRRVSRAESPRGDEHAGPRRERVRRCSVFIPEDDAPVDKALHILQNMIEKGTDTKVLEDLQYVLNVLRQDRGASVVPASLTADGFTLENQGAVKQWLNASFARSTAAAPPKKHPPKPKKEATVGNTWPAPVDPSVEPQLEALFAKIHDWDFNVFAVTELVDQPLLFVTWRVFQEHDFFDRYNINAEKFKTFLREVESRYHANPYHNAEHAADVVQTTHVFLSAGASKFLSEMGQFAVLVAAIVHDVEHNGRNNVFHVKTGSEHALLHNDISVLENHHCCVAFSLISNTSMNFLEDMPTSDYKVLRQMVVHMILGTDMTFHFEHVAGLKNLADKFGSDPDNWEADDLAKVRRFILHAADISNPAKPWETARKWCDRCLDEFWAQGDEEKRLGLDVSPLCDRDTVNVADSQIGFIKFVVGPTFEVMKLLLPGEAFETINDSLNKNLDAYEAMKKDELIAKAEADEKAEAEAAAQAEAMATAEQTEQGGEGTEGGRDKTEQGGAQGDKGEGEEEGEEGDKEEEEGEATTTQD